MKLIPLQSVRKPTPHKRMTFEDHVAQTKKEYGWDNIVFSGKPITKRGKRWLT